MTNYQARMRLELRLVAHEIEADWLRRIHKAIEKEIARGSSAIIRAEQSGSNIEQLAELGIGEGENVEEMLGIACVACQSYINRIWTRFEELNKACVIEFGRKLPSVTTRQEAFHLGAVPDPL